MIYTVTLNPAIDHTVRMESIRYGAVNRAQEGWIVPGGKGINVSILLCRIGMESTALGFCAGVTGELLEQLMIREGCPTELIKIPGMTRINTKLQAEGETDINTPGPPVPEDAVERLMRRLEALNADDCLVLAGSVPPGLPQDIYSQMIQRVSGQAVPTVVDTEGEALLSALAYRPFLIKPNGDELGAIFKRELQSQEEIVGCARSLQQFGARHVLVSLGADGALLIPERGEPLYCPVPPGRAVGTVGAGDSMVAGFLYGWRKTGSLREALRLSVCCGSATAFSPWLADRESIFQLAASFYPDI